MLLCCPYLGHEGALGIGRLVVSLFRRYVFAKIAVDDIGWGTDGMISDLDGSLESRYFLKGHVLHRARAYFKVPS